MQKISMAEDSKICNFAENKRILITNVNGLLGHQLFEQMRNDHITIHKNDGSVPHRFLGTLNDSVSGGMVTPCPSDTIKILDHKSKPKTFAKQVKEADYIVLDISQLNCRSEEAEAVISALKKNDGVKNQVLVVVSSPLVWSNTPEKADGSPYTAEEFNCRVPLPKYQNLKQIELNAQVLSKANPSVRVHVVCSGFPYGNGEQNDIFYDFFRSAWVSLHPELAALPVVNGGKNCLPTIHVRDLANSIERIFT